MERLQDKDYEIYGEEVAIAPDVGPLGSGANSANIWCTTAGATSGE